ncbi:MAG: methyltransferase domain-containing protein [Thaumarchaeota archaeon]|nr:methyltransferase domain-containing protein [Nitrososphaerota archaeon]
METDTGLPREFFSKHAERYAKSESHAHGSDLAGLIELARPKATDVVLDVATGTGFTAMEFAPHVREVVGVDITEEMLEQARKLTAQRGIRNIRFERADACKVLPFADASFDIVSSRRAAHHFTDIPTFLKESRRVLRSKGRLCIVDMSPQEGGQAFANQIEKLRDSTHVRALTASEWRNEISEAGLHVVDLELLPDRVTLEKWLYPVSPGGKEESEIKSAWKRASKETLELFDAKKNNEGEIVDWIKTRIILVAER